MPRNTVPGTRRFHRSTRVDKVSIGITPTPPPVGSRLRLPGVPGILFRLCVADGCEQGTRFGLALRDLGNVTEKVVSMTFTAEKKQSLVEEYRRSDDDTGSPEVQVSILTHRISDMTRHLQANRKDFASRRGLLRMVSTRTRLLRYLSRRDLSRYKELIGRLGLRK